jgi:hypothetical protein
VISLLAPHDRYDQIRLWTLLFISITTTIVSLLPITRKRLSEAPHIPSTGCSIDQRPRNCPEPRVEQQLAEQVQQLLVNLVLSGYAAYRTQLFLYLKACGREELNTMNLWAGVDSMTAG